MKDILHPENMEDIVIIRPLSEPRQKVWKALTVPDLLKQWWTPKGFTTPFSRIDLRVGGSFLVSMRSPEGKDIWRTGVYREIIEPERIVYTDSFSDPDGNPVPASYYGMSEDLPLEARVAITLTEAEGGTNLTLRHSGIPAGVMKDMTKDGWNKLFDTFEALLKK